MYWTCRVSFTHSVRVFLFLPWKSKQIGDQVFQSTLDLFVIRRHGMFTSASFKVTHYWPDVDSSGAVSWTPGAPESPNTHYSLTHCLWGKEDGTVPNLQDVSGHVVTVLVYSPSGHPKWLFSSVKKKKKERTWCDVWPSMVSHTWNLCSSFYPSKYTHTACSAKWTNTDTANAAAPGELPCSRVSPQAQFILLRQTYAPSLSCNLRRSWRAPLQKSNSVSILHGPQALWLVC